MADEKKQELSLEDLEFVGGGAQFPPCDKKKKTTAVAETAEAETAQTETAGVRVATQIW